MPLVMGLDFGTGSVRVGLFDLATRAVVCEREAPYATAYPRLGWAEQSPLDWWEALGQAARAVMQAHGPATIAGIAVATATANHSARPCSGWTAAPPPRRNAPPQAATP